MDEQQLQQQIVQLVQAAMQGDQQATQQIQQIMQAAQQGNQQAAQIAQMIQQVAQQMQQQQVQAARFGAKLNYIKQLKGQCPEGYKMEYYKEGGQLCKKCMKVHQDGGEVKQTPNTVAGQFKMEAAKCGKKMKKKEKGGAIESEKCGGKPKLVKRSGGGKQKYTQTSKSDGKGNIVHTRTYKGESKPVSMTVPEDGDGEAVYSDHRGRSRVADQDSLANVYHNGPKPKLVQKKKQISKHLFGGKPRRPFTGFEDLSYEYSAPKMPVNSASWRAYEPEEETIRSNGKPIYHRETDYDSDAWLDHGKMQKSDEGYWNSDMDGGATDYEPSETTRRVFNSLKRHALTNQYFTRPRFEQGGLIKKNP